MLYKKVFLSLAGKKDESKVIQETMRLVSILGAKLTVIPINDPAAGKAHMMMDTLPEITHVDMAALFTKTGFGDRLNEIEFRFIEDASYAEAIAVASREADLLIMGHHHKNKLMALLTDGTDERVADLIQCAVLLIPAR